MMKFSDMERQILQAQKKTEPAIVKCNKCSCVFFEQVLASKFNADQTVSVGQRLPPLETHSFLRCVRCQETFEPLVQYNQALPEGKAYDAFRDTMEGIGDTREKK